MSSSWPQVIFGVHTTVPICDVPFGWLLFHTGSLQSSCSLTKGGSLRACRAFVCAVWLSLRVNSPPAFKGHLLEFHLLRVCSAFFLWLVLGTAAALACLVKLGWPSCCACQVKHQHACKRSCCPAPDKPTPDTPLLRLQRLQYSRISITEAGPLHRASSWNTDLLLELAIWCYLLRQFIAACWTSPAMRYSHPSRRRQTLPKLDIWC